MKIAIEAQRIFRPNKHGMDFVALETIRELQKMDHENEYFIFVTPGEDRVSWKESDNVHIIELKCPTYPLVGTSGSSTRSKKHQARFAALHQQHGPICTVPVPSGTNIARHNLSGKAPVVQPRRGIRRWDGIIAG